jgi:hypothetical protein
MAHKYGDRESESRIPTNARNQRSQLVWKQFAGLRRPFEQPKNDFAVYRF